MLSARGSADIAALHAAVLADPADDAARQVYADALIEHGDPRGEFIAKQCRGVTDAALLARHGRAWLGELAPVVLAGYRFERGFLAACKVSAHKGERAARLAGHPGWATVRDFTGPAAIALHASMGALRVLRVEPREAWHELLVGTPRPLEELHYIGPATERRVIAGRPIDIPRGDELAALRACRALPRLRRLAIASDLEVVLPAMTDAPVLARVATFALASEELRGRERELFGDLLAGAVVPRVQLTLRALSLVLEVTRDHARLAFNGARQTRAAAWSRMLADEALRLLAHLPRTIRRFELVHHRPLVDADVARLRKAMGKRAG